MKKNGDFYNNEKIGEKNLKLKNKIFENKKENFFFNKKFKNSLHIENSEFSKKMII